MREIAPFGLRIPAAVRQMLQAQADKNRRSLNSEILARLEASLAQQQEK
jgi:hypothetical protein